MPKFSVGSIIKKANVCLWQNLFLTFYIGKVRDNVFSLGGLNNAYGK